MAASPLLDRPAAVARLDGGGADLGGTIRGRLRDFVVEEIPLVRPTGRGDHTMVQIEKRGTSTFEALLFLSKTAKVSERVIGYAGLKDSRAVATQTVTLPKVPPERVHAIRHRKFRVVSAIRHDRPLKIGHLRGNRFTIRIRDVDTAQVEAARTMLETLHQRGMPNAYGRQRFGIRQDGHLLGRAMLLEDWGALVRHFLGRPHPAEMNPRIREARQAFDEGRIEEAHDLWPIKHRAEKKASGVLARGGTPRDAFDAAGTNQRRIWLSAWQSYLFNEVLDARVREGTFDRLLEGDVAWLHESGATYDVTDAASEARRAASGEASPTGPLPGFEPRLAAGDPGRLERRILADAGTDADGFRSPHAKARMLRRPLRVMVAEPSLDLEPGGHVVVRFTLPPGSFATVVLHHLI